MTINIANTYEYILTYDLNERLRCEDGHMNIRARLELKGMNVDGIQEASYIHA